MGNTLGNFGSLVGNKNSDLYYGYTPEQWQTFGASGGVIDGDHIAGSTNSAIGLDAATGKFGAGTSVGDLSGLDNTPGVDTSTGIDMGNILGYGKLGLGALQAGLAYKNYGLQKDAFNFNKMDRNRAYAANKLKYNNQLGRTAAVDSHYGTKSSGTKL